MTSARRLFCTTPSSWWIRFVADPDCARPKTAIAAAMLRAVERALFNPRSELHARTFGFYLDTTGQARAARIAANTFANPRSKLAGRGQ
jgi:hypothetical protein